MTTAAKDALVFENVFSTSAAVRYGILTSLAVQVVGTHWFVTEGAGTLFYLRLPSHWSTRYLLYPRLVLLGYLLPVLRPHQYTRPVVCYLFQICLGSLYYCGCQDVHRVLSELRYVLADSVQKPGSGFMVSLLYYPFIYFSTFSLCCMNAESLIYLIFPLEFLYYSFSCL